MHAWYSHTCLVPYMLGYPPSLFSDTPRSQAPKMGERKRKKVKSHAKTFSASARSIASWKSAPKDEPSLSIDESCDDPVSGLGTT